MGAVASYRNYGFDGEVTEDYSQLFSQQHAQDVLGPLRGGQQKNPHLRMSLTVGGREMSAPRSLQRPPEPTSVFTHHSGLSA